MIYLFNMLIIRSLYSHKLPYYGLVHKYIAKSLSLDMTINVIFSTMSRMQTNVTYGRTPRCLVGTAGTNKCTFQPHLSRFRTGQIICKLQMDGKLLG